MSPSVSVRQETIYIPTYPVGAPEKNPLFLEKRVYQGSSGAVYPYPVIEKVGDEKIDRAYQAIFLENECIEIMILPELGGRVHRAYDKIRQRDFVYYNRVIKPALVGLTGPWISGGIEFNWPQHHRPSTFQPLDHTITRHADGSITVWVNEVEKMSRTKCQTGFTLYPGKAYLEVKGKLYNRTPLPQTFLWWANPAVKVNEHYQSVFPPDVHAVFDHGKRDVSSFPIATGTYYNVDYSPGTDISRYSNIPVPTSYMAIQSQYDFIGGYEHDAQAGMLHVANHHISPGKKQWTWGCGEFGKAWDRNLTDEDGPYVELMTGIFTDNQPDFSWLQPFEEKTFEQYFMPYAGVGLVKNATRNALLNVEPASGGAIIKVFATGWFDDCTIQCLDENNQLVYAERAHLSPQTVFQTHASTHLPFEQLTFRVMDSQGQCLVHYTPQTSGTTLVPAPATAAKAPAEIELVEDLYLNGLHLEQYRHATYHAMDYYQEGLRRSPGDIRCNNATGLWLLRHGQPEQAIPYFEKAILTATSRNPNPYDGEPYYNLGICRMLLGQTGEAYDALYKSTWNDAWQHSGFLHVARIDTQKGDFSSALYHIQKSLVRNDNSHSARHLRCILLRLTGQINLAHQYIEESLQIDPFNFGCFFEGYLLEKENGQEKKAEEWLEKLLQCSRQESNTLLEYAIDYGQAGRYAEAISLLQLSAEHSQYPNPLVYYIMARYALVSGNLLQAQQCWKQAASCPSDYCFPNKVEEMQALQVAVKHQPTDAKAWYYLGNFWFGMQQYPEAMEAFEQSILHDKLFPTAHRNLSLLCFNKKQDAARALFHLKQAFELNTSDARVLMELDQLHSKLNVSPAERLELLEAYPALVKDRDDLYLQRIALLNATGRFEEAFALLSPRKFHPWEGGEGKVIAQYLFCHLMFALDAITKKEWSDAENHLLQMLQYPENLGEGKLHGTPENDLHYFLGLVYLHTSLPDKAKAAFERATTGSAIPKPALFYNDPQPDQILYQGLAWMELGDTTKANSIFLHMKAYGEQHMYDTASIDYFAVSLPDVLVFDKDLQASNRMHCHYLMALGAIGMQQYDTAKGHLARVLETDACHTGALRHQKVLMALQQIQEPEPGLVY